MILVRRTVLQDKDRILQIWIDQWGGELNITQTKTYTVDDVEGFAALEDDQWVGLITFAVERDQCEIVSFDSFKPNQGIGTQLIESVVDEACNLKCRRIYLVTTNDNLNALGFYQKRGFEISAVYRHAMDEVRKIKPAIPLIGMNNIPLRDEIELEMML